MNLGQNAVIASDIAVLSYVKEKYPEKRVHLSVQASASNVQAIEFYRKHFGIKRVVLPRVLTVDEIAALRSQTSVGLRYLPWASLHKQQDSVSLFISNQ